MLRIGSSKPQETNNKQRTKINHQNSKRIICCLKIDYWMLLGIYILVIEISSAKHWRWALPTTLAIAQQQKLQITRNKHQAK